MHGSKFGQRLQAMEYGGMSCSGTESSLMQCRVNSYFVELWSQLIFSNQRNYAGVRCIPRKTSELWVYIVAIIITYIHECIKIKGVDFVENA